MSDSRALNQGQGPSVCGGSHVIKQIPLPGSQLWVLSLVFCFFALSPFALPSLDCWSTLFTDSFYFPKLFTISINSSDFTLFQF